MRPRRMTIGRVFAEGLERTTDVDLVKVGSWSFGVCVLLCGYVMIALLSPDWIERGRGRS